MKKLLLRISLCLVVVSLFSNMFFVSAKDNLNEEQETIRKFSEYCSGDTSYYAKDLINGNILEYDKNTPVDLLNHFFNANYEEIEITENMLPKTLSKEEVLKEVGLTGVSLLATIEPSGIETQQKPFSAVCLLAIKFKNSLEYGIATGFIVGSSEIATVAHNLCLAGAGDVEHIYAYAAFPDSNGRFCYRRYSVRWYEVPQYDSTVETDYACLGVFAGDIHKVHGYFDLNYNESSASLVGKSSWVIGYDGENFCYQTDYNKIDELFSQNEAIALNQKILRLTDSFVEIEANPEIAMGYSGSPLFIVEGGSVFVIGLFSRRVNNRDRAVLISPSVYSYYNARIDSSLLNQKDAIKNISLNKTNFFSGQDIIISVIEAPTQYSWVSLHKISTTSNFAQNATGMWAYIQTGNMSVPTSFNEKSFISVNLSAHIKNVDNGTLYPLPQNDGVAEYKISLFYDNGYTEIAYQPVKICGSFAMPTSYSSEGILTFEYVGTTDSTAWVGVYEEDSLYGHAHPSKAWTYVDVSDVYTETSNAYISPVLLETNKWYCIRLYADNEYILLYEIEFIINNDYTIDVRRS